MIFLTTDKNHKTFLLLSVFTLALFLNPGAVFAAEKYPCEPFAFCIWDVFDTGGNETIQICAGTNQTVRDFNIWFNDTGRFNLSLDYISTAKYLNSSVYDENNGLNNTLGGG